MTAEIDVDFAQEKLEVFRQAWTYMRDGFYDDKFHGVDWEGVRRSYAPRIAGAQSPDEMRRLLNLMVGELNASHMGVSGLAAVATQPSVGKLGLRFDRAEFENQRTAQGHRGHSARSGGGHDDRWRSATTLSAVDGTAIGAETNLDEVAPPLRQPPRRRQGSPRPRPAPTRATW